MHSLCLPPFPCIPVSPRSLLFCLMHFIADLSARICSRGGNTFTLQGRLRNAVFLQDTMCPLPPGEDEEDPRRWPAKPSQPCRVNPANGRTVMSTPEKETNIWKRAFQLLQTNEEQTVRAEDFSGNSKGAGMGSQSKLLGQQGP